MFNRARFVLAAWFTLALVLTLVAVGAAAYTLIRRDIDREINDSLASTRQALVIPQNNRPGPGEGRFGDDDSHDSDDDGYRGVPPGVPADVFIVYTDSGGTVLGNPRQVSTDDIKFADLCQDALNGKATVDVSADSTHYRFVSLRQADGDWVHIGRSLEARDRQLGTLRNVFIVGGIAGVVASGAVGLWLAGRALRPIRNSFEAQRRFVSDASHELRTPLAVMRANGELLQRHPQQSIGDNMDQVEAITAEAEAMTKLVEDLLTLARADESRANIAHEPVSLGPLLEDLGRDMEALAQSRNIQLVVDVEPSEVTGDRHRLRQLAAILLDNALKYTPGPGKVTLRSAQHGKWAEFSVSDTGPGIPAEEQQRIFDRFVRADSARTRATGGTGLGLAIARWIAEAHGGKISVESQPGHGAKFTVRLPASD